MSCSSGTVQLLVGAAPCPDGLVIAGFCCAPCALLREPRHPLNLNYFQSRTNQLQVVLAPLPSKGLVSGP